MIYSDYYKACFSFLIFQFIFNLVVPALRIVILDAGSDSFIMPISLWAT